MGGGEGLLAQGCGFAARCGVEGEDAVSKGGDAGVAAGGAGGGGAADDGEGGVEDVGGRVSPPFPGHRTGPPQAWLISPLYSLACGPVFGARLTVNAWKNSSLHRFKLTYIMYIVSG